MKSSARRPSRKKAPRLRAYVSALREEQAQLTAERILDALGERVRRGDRELTFASVAKEARVSVPTVYRHFPTQDDLFRAFMDREARRQDHPATLTRAGLPQAARTFFRRFEDPDDVVVHGRLNVAWRLSRAATVPRRREAILAMLQSELPGLDEPERTWIADLGVVLFSSATGEAFRGYLGLTGDDVADRVLFAIDALFAHAHAHAHAHAQAHGRAPHKKGGSRTRTRTKDPQ